MINKLKHHAKTLTNLVLKNPIFVSSAMISIATVAAGLFNFAFNLIISNKLGNQQFGIYYPLISLWSIVTLPTMAFQYLMGKDMSVLTHQKNWSTLKAYLKKISLILAIFISAVLILLVIFLPFIKSYFHIQDNMPLIIVYAMVPMPFFITLLSSLIQAREKFNIYVGQTLLGTLSKFIAGVGLVFLLNSYLGALLGLCISQICILLFLAYDFMHFQDIKIAGKEGSVQKDFLKMSRLGRMFLIALLSVGGFQLLNSLDTILVRHFLPESSGVYSAVNLLGKATYFISIAVSFVMLPKMTKDRENLSRSNQKSLIFLFIILFAYALLLVAVSPFISKFLFSGKYPGMEVILPIYGFMFLPFAAVSFLVNYYMVSENIFYSITIFLGAFLEAGLIFFFHKDLIQVSFSVGVSGYAILIALLIDSVLIKKKKTNLI